MRNELEKALVNTFPKIFSYHKANSNQTEICMEFSHGDGWFLLLYDLCTKIQRYCDLGGNEQLVVFQVKEKFGTLRFYYNTGDSIIEDLVRLAEINSSHICEKCGADSRKHFCVGSKTRIKNGWYKTLCVDCAKMLGFKDINEQKSSEI